MYVPRRLPWHQKIILNMEWNTLKCKDGIAINRGAIEAVQNEARQNFKTATSRYLSTPKPYPSTIKRRAVCYLQTSIGIPPPLYAFISPGLGIATIFFRNYMSESARRQAVRPSSSPSFICPISLPLQIDLAAPGSDHQSPPCRTDAGRDIHRYSPCCGECCL